MLRMTLRHRTLALPLVTLSLLAAAFSCPALVSPAQAQQTVLPLWPHGTPEPPQTTEPEADVTRPTDPLDGGHHSVRLTNVTVPTLTVYKPVHDGNGAAALVFPGGAYIRLSWNAEGTDACQWLNSVGVTCILVKYRVPQPPGDAGHYPADPADLEDAQQAMRITRAHAAEWHLDPNRIGVIGFSAGGNLAVLMSTHPDDNHVESTPAAADVPMQGGAPVDARANFAIVVYPAYLPVPPAQTELNPVYTPNAFTPPTFLLQAENDRGYGKNALVYYRALMDTNHPAQLHYYATGGHGFGVFPVGSPEEHWTELATIWLREIHAIPDRRGAPDSGAGANAVSPSPCTTPQPQAGQTRPNPTDTNAAANQQPCW
jgi:acetyl esterase/lipase